MKDIKTALIPSAPSAAAFVGLAAGGRGTQSRWQIRRQTVAMVCIHAWESMAKSSSWGREAVRGASRES